MTALQTFAVLCFDERNKNIETDVHSGLMAIYYLITRSGKNSFALSSVLILTSKF